MTGAVHLAPSYALAMECSCCGEQRDESMVTSLRCHDEIKVCRACVGWLHGRVGAIDVTPTLPVVDMDEASRFCEAAGFDVERYDAGFAFVHLDEQSVFDLHVVPDDGRRRPITPAATSSPATSTAGMSASRPPGLRVTAVEDMPWGMHEFTLSDPSGNTIRIGRTTSGAETEA